MIPVVSGSAISPRLEPLEKIGAFLAASWFESDTEGQREFGGFYARHPKWWHLVHTDTRRNGWIVYVGDDPCGFVDLELLDDSRASAAVYVRIEHRNRGIGRAIVQELPRLAHSIGAVEVFGGVRPHNAASLRMARAAGTAPDGTDDDNYKIMKARTRPAQSL